MRNKGKFLYALVFLGLAIFLVVQSGVARGDVATGGLSRIRVEGTLISVEGATITEVGEQRLHIRALSLSPRIILDATSIASVEPPGGASSKFPEEGPPIPESTGLSIPVDTSQLVQDDSTIESPSVSPTLAPQAFELKLTNLSPQRMILPGEAQWQPTQWGPDKQEVSLQLNLAPDEIKTFQLQTTYSDPDSFTFAVMGDSRGGNRIFSAILKKLNETKPLFAAHCGDLVNNGKRREYRQFIKLIRSFNYPLFSTVGNHDILWWGRMVYQEYFGPTYYSFDFRQAHFIFLDNALGRIDSHQFHWLEQDLQQNTKPYTFMFMHLPPFDPRPDKYHAMNSQLNAQYLMHLATKYGVDRVFCGHIHEYHREERDGVVYIITGGAGSELRDAAAFHHYLLITVNKEGIAEEVIKLD